MYVRRYYKHPKMQEYIDMCRYDKSPTAWKNIDVFVKKHKLHKVEILRRALNRDYTISLIWRGTRL